MKNIEGDDKTLEVLLSGPAFGIDFYQREYRWEQKQVQELVNDLRDQFQQTWNPAKPDTPLNHQSMYFLGSIVVSKLGNDRNIVDGQQRITTLTLLLSRRPAAALNLGNQRAVRKGLESCKGA